MTNTTTYDPSLDLMFERVIDVPHQLVWDAWTKPEQLMQWFCPLPWKTVDCTIDLRPGGAFFTVMRSPEGQEFPSTGCYLEVVPNQKLVWTNALAPGFRPVERPQANPDHECAELLFTGIILLEPHANGTRYTAFAMHTDEDSRARHAQMGFEEGWGAALDQMIAMIKAKQKT